MDEHILPAIFRLDKTIPFLIVEPLDTTFWHTLSPLSPLGVSANSIPGIHLQSIVNVGLTFREASPPKP